MNMTKTNIALTSVFLAANLAVGGYSLMNYHDQTTAYEAAVATLKGPQGDAQRAELQERIHQAEIDFNSPTFLQTPLAAESKRDCEADLIRDAYGPTMQGCIYNRAQGKIDGAKYQFKQMAEYRPDMAKPVASDGLSDVLFVNSLLLLAISGYKDVRGPKPAHSLKG